jgi:hypothetical protein
MMLDLIALNEPQQGVWTMPSATSHPNQCFDQPSVVQPKSYTSNRGGKGWRRGLVNPLVNPLVIPLVNPLVATMQSCGLSFVDNRKRKGPASVSALDLCACVAMSNHLVALQAS